MSDQINIGVNFVFGEKQHHKMECTVAMTSTGYCVWQWTRNGWIVKRNRCRRNCVPQEPSTHGRFEGQYRAVICIPGEYRNKAE